MDSEEKSEATVKEVQKEVKQEKVHGPRGEIGEPTSGLTIKQLWHQAHFRRVDSSDKDHPFRKSLTRVAGAPSLKSFAAKLAKDGNQVAKDWFDHKDGSLNQKRTEANAIKAAESGRSTKAAKRKKKGEGGSK
jgi:hypothetical protein